MIEKFGIGVELTEPEISLLKDGAIAKRKFLVQIASAEDNAIIETVVKYAREHGYNKAIFISDRSVREMLEKQIPQEPLVMLGTDIHICRRCKRELARCEARTLYSYCQWCGQKIRNTKENNDDTST